MSELSEVFILIPSYEPDEKLPKLLSELEETEFKRVVIVNDGSNEKYDNIFNECRQFSKVDVIGYNENHGKGFALKTGFKYILENNPDCKGIITADSDGQHTVEDMQNIAAALIENPDKLILGSRDCLKEHVPLRSRFGNVVTRKVFAWISGTKIKDTQTGLRGFSPDTARTFLTTKGNGFEYEMNMLMEAKMKHVSILEVPIKTIYIEENKTSHFHPIKDSVKIYSVFFKHLSKFVFSSLTATVVDFTLYSVLLHIAFQYTASNEGFIEHLTDYRILCSFIIARLVSSTINYLINKHVVFKEHKKNLVGLLKYYGLVAVICVCTIFLNSFFLTIGIVSWLAQPLATIIMFFISYYFQRVFIFK